VVNRSVPVRAAISNHAESYNPVYVLPYDPSVTEDPMYRLIYKSRSTREIDWPTVQAILNSSENQNREHDIDGVLLATDTHFLQVLEGRFEDVNDTFMRIVQDSRHTDLRLISYGVIDARLFPGWGMKGIGVFDLNKSLEARLLDKYGEENGTVKFPLEEWMVLAMIQDINTDYSLPSWKEA
jgi:hypothetical protein